MDKIRKALNKLFDKERDSIRIILEKLHSGNTQGLNISKLKGHDDIFRIRKGKLRIIFRIEMGTIYLLKIDRRDDTTYGEF